MTPAEAKAWLAEHLPELREPCPGFFSWGRYGDTARHHDECCDGRTWVPVQEETALHRAMNRVGYDVSIRQSAMGRSVMFYKTGTPVLEGYTLPWPNWLDANDWLAAYKALSTAGVVVGYSLEGEVWR